MNRDLKEIAETCTCFTGIIFTLTGVAMCDSDRVIIPIIFLAVGLSACLIGARGYKDDETITDYTSNNSNHKHY